MGMIQKLLVNMNPRYWAPRTTAVVGLAGLVILAGLGWMVVSSTTSSAPVAPPTTLASQVGSNSTVTQIGGNGVTSVTALVGSDQGTPAQSGMAGAVSVSSSVPTKGQIAVYMDGWSMANLKTSYLGISTSNLGPSAPTSWRTVTSADVAELQKDAPGLLQDVATRMISPASSVKCTTTGCVGPQGAIDPSWFVNPSAIPGLGAEYQAYGIAHTLYVMTLSQSAASSFWLRYGNSAISVTPAPPAGASSGGPALGPTAAEGYGADRYLVASGMGQLFFPFANWKMAKSPTLFNWVPTSTTSATSGADMAVARTGLMFTGGLGTVTTSAVNLNNGQLTYMTSPSTGCGVGVLCVPGVASGLRVSASAGTTGKYCESGSQVAAVVVHEKWTYDFTGPTLQNGVWGKEKPATFASSTGSDPFFWTGVAPMAKGATTWSSSVVYVTSSTIPTLVVLGGQVGSAGSDSSLISSVLGSGWSAC